MISWREVLGELAEPEFEIVARPRSGASGPKVYLIRGGPDGNLFAVKYGNPRVPLHTQLRNRGVLSEYMEKHLPQVVRYVQLQGDLGDAMVMEAPTQFNFHEVVTQGKLPDQNCLVIWDRVLNGFLKLWIKTQEDFAKTPGVVVDMPRKPKERSRRISQDLKSRVIDDLRLSEVLTRRVFINGTEYPSLDDLLRKVENVPDPLVTVVCHGDPNADNILIDAEGRQWWLVDWEWVGKTDWRLSVSHLIGWWFANAIYQREEPHCCVDATRVEFNFCVRLPGVCIEMASRALAMAESFSREQHKVLSVGEGEDKDWKDAVKNYIIQLLLGDLRFLNARDRQSYALPLLGEAIRLDSMELEDWFDSFTDGKPVPVNETAAPVKEGNPAPASATVTQKT